MQRKQTPWIEVKSLSPKGEKQYDFLDRGQTFTWQAMFACQINILTFEERFKFKWGLNSGFLLEEAIDRQRLFLEAQLFHNSFDEQFSRRTLALRCIRTSDSNLQLSLLACIQSDSEENANLSALQYWHHLNAIFPYDYSLYPAVKKEDYYKLTGKAILDECNSPNQIANIRRFETPIRSAQESLKVVGTWQTSKWANEQIWRALANYPQNILFNISIRPTILFEGERKALLDMRKRAKSAKDLLENGPYIQNYDEWLDAYIQRFISPWNRYFYLQIHLASPENLDDHIFRSIGSALTRNIGEFPSTGFQALTPTNENEALEWTQRLANLRIIHVNKSFMIPRLSELSELEEAHSVFRLPYPPEFGFPNANFLEGSGE